MKRRSFHGLVVSTTFAAPFFRARAAGEEVQRPIRIGQIGTAHAHASGQLAMLRECPEFEVVGVVEPDPARRAAMSEDKTYQGLQWLSEEELLAVPGLEAVAVETVVKDLLSTAQRVADAGLHLHLDKPAGESLPAFRRVVETLVTHNRLLKMGYMFRYNAGFDLITEAMENDWLGPIHTVHAEMSKKMPPGKRDDLVGYAGGSQFELGCHVIDSVIRYLGPPDRIQWAARDGSDGYADLMVATFEYPQALATVRSSLREVSGGPRRQFVIAGERGTIEIQPLDSPKAIVTMEADGGPYRKGRHEVEVENRPRYLEDWKAFAKAIRGEEQWPFSPAHDLAVQEAVMTASGLPLD